jgi:polyhydroxyalkanoate synthase subunit PhaC
MELKSLTNLLSLATRPKPQVGTTPADVVWEENKWKLLRYRPRAEGVKYQTPLLLVPSLINRHYVLDLMPGKSFAESMVQRGFDVFCIDWGTPGDEDRFVSFDDVVDRWLGRAIRVAAKTVPHEQVHLLGYCMGGTLTAIHGAVHPERIASMITLAAPIRFNDGSLLSRWTNVKGFDVDVLVNTLGTVPWQLLQSAFHMLRPTLSLSKAVSLLDRAWNDEFLDGFLALETWGNDNVSLPGEFYRRYIKALYQDDGLLAGRFALSGRRVDLKHITFPTLAVSFEHDNIVPGPSAGVLIEAIGSKVKQHLHLPGGHVGAVVSKHAAKTLWPQLEVFYAAHDAPPAKVEPAVMEAVAQVLPLREVSAERRAEVPVAAQDKTTAATPALQKTKPTPPRAAAKTGSRTTPRAAVVKRLPVKKPSGKPTPRVAR